MSTPTQLLRHGLRRRLGHVSGHVAAWLPVLLAATLALVSATPANAQTLPTSEDCRSCHLTLEEERLSAPAVVYDSDVHAETGFGCLACHGSGGGDALDPAAGFLAAPARREIPEMCGRCHSDAAYMRQFDPGLRVDQVQEYWTSRHGELLREQDDPAVATCIDCHPAHEIRPPDDPSSTVHASNIVSTCGRCHADPAYMVGRDLPTDQVGEYTTSVHGQLLIEEGDLSAPVCNDCHGNHGAAPPGLASVRNVCGQCHSVMADYFDESAHGQIFEEADLPGCALCHEHHAVQPVEDVNLVDRSQDVCVTCHEPPDPAGLEFDRMAAVLDTLRELEERGRDILEEAENAGMEVSQALFELEEVGNVRTRARSAIHTFRVEQVREEVAAGLEITEQAADRGHEALGEYDFRRLGLGTFAVIVVLLIAGLTLKIREYEERMEELAEQVEAFYRGTLAASQRREPSEQEIQIAVSALMLEVCLADGALTPDEQKYLEALARRRFDLQAEEAAQLIRLAERERGRPGQLDRITSMIADHFPLERKWVLLDGLWALIAVDGAVTVEEEEFMERLTYLIGVDAADSLASKRRGTSEVSGLRDHESHEGETT